MNVNSTDSEAKVRITAIEIRYHQQVAAYKHLIV